MMIDMEFMQNLVGENEVEEWMKRVGKEGDKVLFGCIAPELI